MASATRIAAGEYEIGPYSIPRAGSAQLCRLPTFWIDVAPVSFGHFERFVAGGGYDNEYLWNDPRARRAPRSIDQRCDQLLEQSFQAARLFRDRPKRSVDIPLVGVSWAEAAAIARFAGGRLPSEIEWEVAMKRRSDASPNDDRGAAAADVAKCWESAPRSRWGCIVANRVLQEWTSDTFFPNLLPADVDRHGTLTTPTQGNCKSVRGSCRDDVHTDYRVRRGADHDELHSQRGFRRVWDNEPALQQCSASFVLSVS